MRSPIFVFAPFALCLHVVTALAATVEDDVKTMAAMVSKNLPMKLSQNMTLAQVAAVGPRIVYAYVIHRDYADMRPHLAQFKELSRKDKVSTLCGEKDARSLLDRGSVYAFTFASADAHFAFAYDVKKADCQ